MTEDYIRRGRARYILCDLIGLASREALDAAIKKIEDEPAADITPLQHGHWKDKMQCSNMCGYDYSMVCSVCEKPMYRLSPEPMPPYCPNCGAKMQ